MGNFDSVSVRAAVCALGFLGFAGAAPAQFTPDANTAALWHFDTQTAAGTTPDAGPGGFDGTLAGAVLPAHEPAPLASYGFAYNFDGVDRGADNSRIDMGNGAALAMRGSGDFTLDVLLTVAEPLADDGYFRGIVCRASDEGIDYSLSYLSWTRPSGTPEHQLWFSTGPGPESTTEYAYAAIAFAGLMQVGTSYAIRATVASGVMTLTVNGIEGTSTYYPAQPGLIAPNAAPVGAPLRVGDACPKDYVVKPSELQVDELRLSDIARTELLPGELQALLGPLLPVDPGFTDAQSALAFRRERLSSAVPPVLPVVPAIAGTAMPPARLYSATGSGRR